MRRQVLLALSGATATLIRAASLEDVCTASYVQSVLPLQVVEGITFDTASIAANPVTSANITASDNYPAATDVSYCNVTMSYSHDGRNDTTLLWYWLPTPDSFQNRFLTTGGGGEKITSGDSSLPGGIVYGAAAGTTDGGFGGFNAQLTDVLLKSNGTLDYVPLFAFGYVAIHEMTVIGKELTKNFFNATKIYTYYQACSEGGREGWSQVQRYADQFDGAVIGAPAFRQAFQQVNHLTANMIEKTLDYYPSSCELEKINNDTIAACDALDGKTDGVVSRTDLCKLQYNVTASVGKYYSCAATSASSMGGMGGPATTSSNSSITSGNTAGYRKRQMMGGASSAPAANGTVTAEAAQVANAILDGLHDTQGRRVYIPYQYSATFDDAATQYNSTSGQYELEVSSLGAQYVQMFLNHLNSSSLPNFANATYDTLRTYMIEGLKTYSDTLQSTWPDLTDFAAAGGKVIHYHGESDYSIPTASSVRYFESVRKVMYPTLSYNESVAKVQDFYRLFLIPGAGHCSPSTTQTNGPFPQTILQTMIDWVEKGQAPATLPASILQGENQGDSQDLCAWPLRPIWSNNGTSMDCVYDQPSIDSWHYTLDSIPVPVY